VILENYFFFCLDFITKKKHCILTSVLKINVLGLDYSKWVLIDFLIRRKIEIGGIKLLASIEFLFEYSYFNFFLKCVF
jgi:hypothetical protein